MTTQQKLLDMLPFLTLLFVLQAACSPPEEIQAVDLFPAGGGYIDNQGKMVIPQQFDNAGGFSEGLATVRIGKHVGYIDKIGRIVIEPKFDDAGFFSEGLALAVVGKKLGYTDQKGQWVIPPQFDFGHAIEYVPDFSEGRAVVRVGNLYGFVDRQGLVIEPRFEYAWPYLNGLAGVKLNDKWGFIDKTGDLVISNRFDEIGSFQGGLAPARSGNSWVFIDTKGDIVVTLSPAYGLSPPSFAEGIIPFWVRHYYSDTTNTNKMGYIDTTGRVVIEPRFSLAYHFAEGLAPVYVGKRCGYIDKVGKFVIPIRFDGCGGFDRGLAWVTTHYSPDRGTKDTVGYINKSGEYVWQAPATRRSAVLLTITRYVYQTRLRVGF